MESTSAVVWTRRSALSVLTGSAVSLFLGCTPGESPDEEASSDIGKVIIVGAGPAGLTVAHLLQQRGIDFVVLEAAPTHGGRTKSNLNFVDFPIPLGAEWVHVSPNILSEIVNDPDVSIETELLSYGAEAEQGWFEDGQLELSKLNDSDIKFVDSGWLDFFDTHVVPGIAGQIKYNTQVTKIEHGPDSVRLSDVEGTVYDADRVVVTVPLKILQRGDVDFDPPLEDDRLAVIAKAPIWSGFKAFFEFSEAFYPTALSMPGDYSELGQRLYYDAAYGQRTSFNVLGLFAVGDWAEQYQALSESDLRDRVLSELDAIFDGAATRSYVRHLAQNWNEDPFARAAYLADDAPSSITKRLAEPLNDRVFFAGDAYTTFDDWSSVHTATRSAGETVERLLDL